MKRSGGEAGKSFILRHLICPNQVEGNLTLTRLLAGTRPTEIPVMESRRHYKVFSGLHTATEEGKNSSSLEKKT